MEESFVNGEQTRNCKGATELFGFPMKTARHTTKEKGLVNRGAGQGDFFESPIFKKI